MSNQAGRAGVAPSLAEEDRRHSQRPNDETVTLAGACAIDSIYAAVAPQQKLTELEARLEQLAPLYRLLLRQTHPN